MSQLYDILKQIEGSKKEKDPETAVIEALEQALEMTTPEAPGAPHQHPKHRTNKPSKPEPEWI